MRTRLFVITLLLASMATGCTVTQSLSPDDKQRISKLYINEDIKKADQLYYYPSEMSAIIWFGVIGAVAVAGSVEESRASLEKFVNDKDISIEAIFYRNFLDALTQANQYQIVDDMESADAVINIDIYQYGFSVPTHFTTEIVPIVAVKCEMYDAKGDKLWQAGDRVLTLGNPAESFPPEDMNANPNLIRQAWEVASAAIAKNIVAEL